MPKMRHWTWVNLSSFVSWLHRELKFPQDILGNARGDLSVNVAELKGPFSFELV